MSNDTQYELQHKSRGCGCTGCGCAALVLLAFLGIALVAKSVPDIGRKLNDFLALPPLGEAAPTGIGKHLSKIELVSLAGDGEAVSQGDLAGKVVLMTFWGTWCPPCRTEMPEIAELEKKFGEKPDFRLLAVSCGQGVEEDFEQLHGETRRYLLQERLVVPCYADPNGVTRNAVDEAAGFSGYPTTLILDRKGAIQGIWTGYRAGATGEMERLIERLLQEE